MSVNLELVNKNIVKHHNLIKSRFNSIDQQLTEIQTQLKQLKEDIVQIQSGKAEQETEAK